MEFSQVESLLYLQLFYMSLILHDSFFVLFRVDIGFSLVVTGECGIYVTLKVNLCFGFRWC